jgi:hypothetical protein
MYAWLWHRLPGRTPALWFYVFPWASIHLPIDSVRTSL